MNAKDPWAFAPIEPRWWPYWGWGWRALQRGGPVIGTVFVVAFPATILADLIGYRRDAGWVFFPPFVASWLIFAAIALWARPKALIPPWARAQSGALRELSDWWISRRPS